MKSTPTKEAKYIIEKQISPTGAHYRVTETATDSRIATCYLEENAKLVAAALNQYAELQRR